jgi:UDP-N-acetylmuramate dehydrogenase
MELQYGVSLKPYNTLGLDVKANFYVDINNIEDLRLAREFCRHKHCPWLLIGGGSNLVLTQNFEGLVMFMAMDQVFWPAEHLVSTASDQFVVSAQAGYEWDLLVEESIIRGASGLENLSLIPGQVGAAPIQNIGAYGVELKHCLDSVEVFDFDTGERFQLLLGECELGYRDSIFKRHQSWIITQVKLLLSREHKPKLSYGIIADTVTSLFGQSAVSASPQQIRDAVIHIRRSKLPDPKKIPNVGSFFKNPVIDTKKMHTLVERWPGLVVYAVDQNNHKLAAGWLIDQLGWKGYRQGEVGVHEHQALVLVCSGACTGKELLDLAKRIKADVAVNFGVTLEIEPRLFDSRGEFHL